MKAMSFFSGAFGLDLGLEEAGVTASLAVEIDDHCCRTLRANRPDLNVVEADVGSIAGEDLTSFSRTRGTVDLIVGGPPCQSFSPGGKRAALTDPRGNLIYEYLRLVGELRPRLFVLENVANILTAALRHRPISERPGQHWSLKRYSGDQHSLGLDDCLPHLEPDEQAGSAVRQVLKDIEFLGYQVSFGIHNAADYGAPQHRLRFVLFGSLGSAPPSMIAPTHGATGTPYVTLRDAIGDLTQNPGPGSQYTDDVRGFFDLVPPGKNWRALPADIQPAAMGGSFAAGGGKTGFYRRLAWDHPAPTITGRANRKGSALCHPDETRPLSVAECARIQGFPDSWTFSGSMNRQYLQVGNAVPVALGRAVGESIRRWFAVRRRPIGRTAGRTEALLESALTKLRSYARNKLAVAPDGGPNGRRE